MTPSDLEILVQEGEGTTLEFKEGVTSSLGREIVAFANTIGGKILLGVRDDGSTAGIRDTNSLRARIQDLAHNCDPPVPVVVEPFGNVVVVHVKESDSKPVQCSVGFFRRQGAVTQMLNRDEIRDLFRIEGSVRFDVSPCPGFAFPQDFDRDKFDTWRRLSGISRQAKDEDVLVSIEVAERANGGLLIRNVGALFFAKNPRQFFPHAYITCLLARGTEKVHVLDRKDFDGGIVSDIEDALRFVERNTRTAYRIEGLRRENVPEYPTRSLREAIANAVMHRDWLVGGANVFVQVYSDRVEIVSPGGLPQGLTLANFGGRSIRRNALIADLLHRIDIIEKAGTGILRIRDEARNLNCPEPKFEANGFFTATFWPNPEVRATDNHSSATTVVDGATEQVTGEVGSDTGEAKRKGMDATAEVNSSTEEDTSKGADATAEVGADAGEDTSKGTDATAEDKRIIQLVRTIDGEMTRQEIQDGLGLKHAEHFRLAYLSPALRAGLIEMTVPERPRSRNQRYRLTGKGKEVCRKLKFTK